MPRDKAYFLSDFHLGAAYVDNPREAEQRIVRFLQSIEDEASEIYLLGDILDYWYEYRNVVPRGFVRFFGQIARMTDAGIKVTWFIGNHDIWIFDYLPSELGIDIVDGILIKEIQGRRVFMEHGDGVGKLRIKFRFLRSLFRNRICQHIYSGIHPRWTIPFALGWSRKSRSKSVENTTFSPNCEALPAFAKDYIKKDPNIDYFIFGHRHVAANIEIGKAQVVILGDWISRFSYAEMSAGMISLKQWDPLIEESHEIHTYL